MNPQNDPVALFQNEIRQWEHHINSYNGPDPLDFWFRYICWLESNVNQNSGLEEKFRKSVEQCLSLYDKYENYKQDLRMVKLWIKYIDFQPNPLNLYKILFEQRIGTKCAAFYIGWAHYYNSDNAFKAAESIYNLGVQLKAEPLHELENAQKNFRYSVAQRMLYDDSSSKKRTISSLAEQRQQITSLSPQQPQKRFKADDVAVEQYSQQNVSQPNMSQQMSSHSSSSQYSSSQDYQYAGSSTDPGSVISSSLNYVYNDSNIYGSSEDSQQTQEEHVAYTFECGFQAPPNFFRSSRNTSDPWNVPLCLEEPFDPNRRCFYPKHRVYPGNNTEYSLEELKALKIRQKIEEQRLQEELRVQREIAEREERLHKEQEQIAIRLQQEQERLRQEQEAQRLRMEQEKLQIEEAARRQKEDTERRNMELYHQQQQQMTYNQSTPAWNYHQQNQSPANYGNYYQSSYENSPQYQYNNGQPDPQYQTHYQSQHGMYQQSPQNYQNSPNFHQQPNPSSVIVSQNQYETHQTYQTSQYYDNYPAQSPHQQYNNYHVEQQTSSAIPIVPVESEQSSSQSQTAQLQPEKTQSDEHDYQDVEYLIDHQSEIDPTMLEQYIIESYDEEEEGAEDEREDSEYEQDSDDSYEEEPYSGPAPVVNSYMLDDLEEQIEASTISFSSNGKSRDKKITIKFRKEKTATTVTNSESNSGSSTPPVRSSNVVQPLKVPLEPSSTSSSLSSVKKKGRKAKFQNELLAYDGESTQFMPSANNSCSSTVNGDGNNASFGNISFSNGILMPARKPISKTSTPVSSYKFLKKPSSVVSLQNDDSICSYNGDQNSLFVAENDEDFKSRRMEKALTTIDEQLARRDIDPFSTELCKAFLVKLNFPNRENTTDYKITNMNLPKLSKNQVVPIGGVSYQIEKEVGRGSYGAVYRGVNMNDGSAVALKYQKPPNSWELYICTEVRKRMKNSDILPGFMSITAAVIAPNASVLISEFSQFGSLLDINNRIRTATTKVMHESLVMHFSAQILDIVYHLHSYNIIHADIKPDNFLLMTIPSADTHIPSLRLIDFGCAIDMNLFKPDTEFRKIIQTDGFTCIEMQEGRPWSYQTDLFCVAGTIHVMLFGEYMQVNKKFGVWEIKQKFPRYLNKTVWSDVFAKLLNIKDKDHLPDLRKMRAEINSELNYNELVKNIRTVSNLIRKR